MTPDKRKKNYDEFLKHQKKETRKEFPKLLFLFENKTRKFVTPDFRETVGGREVWKPPK